MCGQERDQPGASLPRRRNSWPGPREGCSRGEPCPGRLCPLSPRGVSPGGFGLRWGCSSLPALFSSAIGPWPSPAVPVVCRSQSLGPEELVCTLTATSPESPLNLRQVCPGPAPWVTTENWALGRTLGLRPVGHPRTGGLAGGQGSPAPGAWPCPPPAPGTVHPVTPRPLTGGEPVACPPSHLSWQTCQKCVSRRHKGLRVSSAPSPRPPGESPGEDPDGERASSTGQVPCSQP